MAGQIQIRCPKCNKTMMNDRQPEDPVQAMECVIICPACDDGDFHSPTYLSASGREIDWDSAAKRSDATTAATF